MPLDKASVVITGVAGNLGLRLCSLLSGFEIVGVDLKPPRSGGKIDRFAAMDLSKEASCRELYLLLREVKPVGVVHLAFVIDAVRTGILDTDRMWHGNVAGTARVMEAITEANRDGSMVEKFIYPSSVAVYGTNLNGPATEDSPLAAHTLPYAIHKMEVDRVVQQRAPALSGCSAFMLRPHIFAGSSVQNYLIDAFRGTPNGKSARAKRMREHGKRLPCVLPYGRRYLENRIQFVHVDDVARLITFILKRMEPESQRLTILNVAGRGEPVTFGRCIEMARAKLVRVPGKWGLKQALNYTWKMGLSAIPPEAVPYMTSEYIMNTDRLKSFLGPDYENVLRYTVAGAFADSFATPSAAPAAAQALTTH
jgi:nucleoside-diphosphate-sugar epimerase